MTTLPRILLVEDDPGDMHLALAALRDMNLADQVFTLTDGVDASDFLQGSGKFSERPPGNPALVLLDLKLPRMGGLELLAWARNQPAFKLIPIVCLTSSREDNDMRRAYELGANAYVVKSIDYKDYKASMKSIGAFWARPTNPRPDRSPVLPLPELASMVIAGYKLAFRLVSSENQR